MFLVEEAVIKIIPNPPKLIISRRLQQCKVLYQSDKTHGSYILTAAACSSISSRVRTLFGCC